MSFFKKATPPKASQAEHSDVGADTLSALDKYFIPFEAKAHVVVARVRARPDGPSTADVDAGLAAEPGVSPAQCLAHITGLSNLHRSPAPIPPAHGLRLLQFHDNHRPAYFGSYSKKSAVVTPRRPFARDVGLFDYEVDSDDEWEV